MSHIEKFIREHRQTMDVFAPTNAAWEAIDASMKEPLIKGNRIQLFKLAGVLALIVAAVVFLFKSDQEPPVATSIPGGSSNVSNSREKSHDQTGIVPSEEVHRNSDIEAADRPASKTGSIHEQDENLSINESPAIVQEQEPSHYTTEVSPFKVRLCKGLNTPSFEYAPYIIDELGSSIIFASIRGPEGKFAHLYHSQLDNGGNWTSPRRIDTTTGNSNNAVISIDKTRKVLYFTHCRQTKSEHPKCGIYYSFMQGSMVGEPIEVQFEKPGTGNYNYGHPHYSNELDVLFFTSDMPGGYGGLDIWFMKYDKKSDSWSKPQNMGQEINTKMDEAFPSLRNGAFYFSSSGHGGFGKWDIMKAEKTGADQWGKPTNMGTPINSEGDDFAMTFRNDESGYFTSNRQGGAGEDDIYEFYITESSLGMNHAVMAPQQLKRKDSTMLDLAIALNKEACNEPVNERVIANSKISPNPSQGNFTFEFSSDQNDEFTIRIFSTNGQVLINEKITKSEGLWRKSYDLTGLAKGIFYVQVIQNCIPLETQKLIIQ